MRVPSLAPDIPRQPLLAGEAGIDNGQVVVRSTNRPAHRVEGGSLPPADLAAVLARFDGRTLIAEVEIGGKKVDPEETAALARALDAAGWIDDPERPAGRPGLEVILELEDEVEKLSRASIFVNPFWMTCLAANDAKALPRKLATGMVIENWHFLFRESYFDAPVLSYVGNREVRLLLNEFFHEENGHDEILLKTLNHAGLSRADMLDAIPLPETMALCNALAFWAHNDPLFFFVTLGLLEGQGVKHDSFIEACERCGYEEEFVGPLRTHANINLGAGHGNLTRAIFRAIPLIDPAAEARLRHQLPLFVRLYDDFYTGVWRHYTSDAPLLRRVSEYR